MQGRQDVLLARGSNLVHCLRGFPQTHPGQETCMEHRLIINMEPRLADTTSSLVGGSLPEEGGGWEGCEGERGEGGGGDCLKAAARPIPWDTGNRGLSYRLLTFTENILTCWYKSTSLSSGLSGTGLGLRYIPHTVMICPS